jgi:uncharacterized protein (TIGR01244 family)
MSRSIRVPAAALLVLALVACGAAEETAQAADTEVGPTPTLADATAVGLRNAKMPLEGLVTGGQPTQAQVAELVSAGFDHFISLRLASEDGAGWEESGVASGATFARLPISGGADLTRENVEALDRLLGEAEGDETVLYCASGNRVGALLALRAAWIQGMPAEEAMALGRAAGMTRLETTVGELLGETN